MKSFKNYIELDEISIKLRGFGDNLSRRQENFMQDLHDTSSPHPFNNYQRIVGDSTVHVSPSSTGIHLHDIVSFHPKSGEGTKTLKHLTGLADKHNIKIDAVAKAYSNDDKHITNSTKLKSWYEKHGFETKGGDKYDGYDIHYTPKGHDSLEESYLEEKFRFTLKYHDKLNPKLWKNDQLKPGIAPALLNLAYKFAAFSGVSKSRIKDIIITGGNVNYNYTKFSDIDIHLLCDVTGLDSDALYEKKVEWSNTHSDKIAGYPLEFYVGNIKEVLPKGQGFFSIMDTRWIIIPKHLDKVDALEDQFVIDKILYKIKEIKRLIKSGTVQEIEKFKEKMHDGRSAGLQKKGEFSVENVIYKELRNRKWIEKLNDRLHSLKSLS